MIWEEIEARMDAFRRYDAFRTRLPWRYLPARLRLIAYTWLGA